MPGIQQGRSEAGGSEGVRIAMWAGPRTISTALLRAWGSRPDTFVCDEPLYAHYLMATHRDHPGLEEIVRVHETNAGKVIARLTGEIPDGKAIFYQKHMAHHLLPGMDRSWLRLVRSAFLIRDPREMLTSLIQVTPDPSLEDTGLPQQWELFERTLGRTGEMPPVIDSRDVLENLLHHGLKVRAYVQGGGLPEPLLERLPRSLLLQQRQRAELRLVVRRPPPAEVTVQEPVADAGAPVAPQIGTQADHS